MHSHSCASLLHLQVAYILRRRWRLMGKLQQRAEWGYFESWGNNRAKSEWKGEQKGMQRDKESMSVTSWPHSAPSPAAAEQQTFPPLVNCGGIGRRVCLFLINPFLNYRAEGICRADSARISPNEPPSFFIPQPSRLLMSFLVCLGLCYSWHLCLYLQCCFMQVPTKL